MAEPKKYLFVNIPMVGFLWDVLEEFRVRYHSVHNRKVSRSALARAALIHGLHTLNREGGRLRDEALCEFEQTFETTGRAPLQEKIVFAGPEMTSSIERLTWLICPHERPSQKPRLKVAVSKTLRGTLSSYAISRTFSLESTAGIVMSLGFSRMARDARRGLEDITSLEKATKLPRVFKPKELTAEQKKKKEEKSQARRAHGALLKTSIVNAMGGRWTNRGLRYFMATYADKSAREYWYLFEDPQTKEQLSCVSNFEKFARGIVVEEWGPERGEAARLVRTENRRVRRLERNQARRFKREILYTIAYKTDKQEPRIFECLAHSKESAAKVFKLSGETIPRAAGFEIVGSKDVTGQLLVRTEKGTWL